MFPVISSASDGPTDGCQNGFVIIGIKYSPTRYRKTNAINPIKMMRVQDSGRLKPIAEKLPLRNRIDIIPITNKIGTSFGMIFKTLWPITINAPIRNSIALIVRNVRESVVDGEVILK